VVSGFRDQNILQKSPVIGRLKTYAGYGLDGQISDFRVIKGVAVYTSPFSVPTTRLQAIPGTVLLISADAANGYLADRSSSAHTVSSHGSVSYTADGPPLQSGPVAAVNGVATLAGTLGTMTLNTSTGAYTYQPLGAAVDALQSGATASDSVLLTVSDGVETVTTTLQVTATGENDLPKVTTSTGSTSVLEQQWGVIDPGVIVSDADNATLASATVVVATGFQSGEDALGYTNPGSHGNIEGTYNATVGVLTLTSASASATSAEWQQALREVRYRNTSESPTAGDRTLRFTVNDGAADSALAVKLVTVLPENDSPVIAGGVSGVDLPDIAEDSVPAGGEVLTLLGSAFSDPDNPPAPSPSVDTFSGIAVVLHQPNTTMGLWQYRPAEGGTWTDLPAVGSAAGAVTLRADAFLRFLPAANFNGAAPVVTVVLMDSSEPVTTGALLDATVRGGGTPFSSATLEIRQNVTPVADELSIIGLGGVDKPYDGTRTAMASGQAQLVGVPPGDEVQLIGTPVFTFAQSAVGEGIAIEVSGYSLSGPQAGLYTLTLPTLSANITARSLSVGGLIAEDKVYDATPVASVSGQAQLVGVVGGDDVELVGTPAFEFAQETVGSALVVSGSGYQLSGAAASNYTLLQPTLSAAITPKGLELLGVVALDKVYDGTVDADLDVSAAQVSGVIGDDAVTLNTGSSSGAFTTPTVGVGKSVAVSGVTLSGADSGNYEIVPPSNLTATITAKELVLRILAATRAYRAADPAFGFEDFSGQLAVGDTMAEITGGDGLGADLVYRLASTVVTSGVGSYPGEIGVDPSSLDGTQVGNYAIEVTPGDLQIVPATLGITFDAASLEQVYDGTPRSVVFVTDPAGVAVQVRYRTSLTPPALAGTYAVVASSDDPNYVGEVSGVLRIITTLSSLRAELAVISAGLLPVSSEDGQYVLQATLGQPIAEPLVQGSTFGLEAGFWSTDTSSLFWELGTFPGGGSPAVPEAVPVVRDEALGFQKPLRRPGGETSGHFASIASQPRLLVQPMGNSVRLQIQISGRPQSRWQIQFREQLTGDGWRNAGELRLDARGRGILQDELRTEGSMRFYRLVSP
jgi:VCBS repeat-containing protein